MLGHEAMGIVEEVGPEAGRPPVPAIGWWCPFNIGCGHCWMCVQGLFAQCETTQVREHGERGRRSSGTPRCTAPVPGGQAEYLRMPERPSSAPDQGARRPRPTSSFLYLSDVLPDGVAGGGVRRRPPGGTRRSSLGLGPVGHVAVRIALHPGRSG